MSDLINIAHFVVGTHASIQILGLAEVSIWTQISSQNSPRSHPIWPGSNLRALSVSNGQRWFSLTEVWYRCGNVGKLTRIAATVSDPSFASLHPRKKIDAPFLVLGGFADFILPAAFVNGHGAIIGLANVAPVGFWFSHREELH